MLKDLLTHPDIVDAAKAAPVAAVTGAWWLNVSLGQVVTLIGGIYTVIVAIEKFYKVAMWAIKKFKKPARPPEG